MATSIDVVDLKGKKAAENITSSWAEVAEEHGADVVGVDGMNEAMASLKEGRVDAIVNDKLAVRNYIATAPDPGVKVVAETDDKAQSVFAAKKGSGYMPEINKALAEMEADGTTQQIYDKYFSADNATPSSWDLVKTNAWPMAWKAIAVTIPLTAISFVVGLALVLLRPAAERGGATARFLAGAAAPLTPSARRAGRTAPAAAAAAPRP